MRQGLFFLFFCYGIGVQSANIDLEAYVAKYPDEEFVTLTHTVSLKYYFDDDNNLKAKSTHRIEQLSLVDDCDHIRLIQVPFSSFESLTLKSARYYELDSTGGKTLRENIKIRYAEEKDYFINGIYYSDLKVKQFGPNVDIVAGSLVSYSYDVIYKDLKFISRYMPQMANEPVESFKLTVSHPEEVTIEIFEFNLPSSAKKSQKQGKSSISDIRELQSVQPISDYSFRAPSLYNQAHYVITTKGYTHKKEFHPILNSTEDLYKWYISLVNQLSSSDEFVKTLSKEIVGNTTIEKEKIELIYSWIQENLVYVAFEDGIAGFKPEEASQVAAQKFGDCKGISNLLVNLLQASGVDAHHAWIGTRRLPYDYSMPSLVVDNHMICAVRYDNAWLFLDGTDPNTSWDLPSSHIQGKRVLIAKGNEYEVQTVPEGEAEKNLMTADFQIDLSNSHFSKLTGTINFSGYEKNDLQGWYKNVTIQRRAKIPERYSEYILDYFFSDKGTLKFGDEGASMEIRGEISGNYFVSNDKMLLFWDLGDDFEFSTSDTVDYHRYYPFRFNKSYTLKYKLPSQSELKEIPQNISYKSNNGKFECTVQFELANNTLICKKTVVNHALLIEPSDMDEWRGFIQELIKIKGSYVEIKL